MISKQKTVLNNLYLHRCSVSMSQWKKKNLVLKNPIEKVKVNETKQTNLVWANIYKQ